MARKTVTIQPDNTAGQETIIYKAFPNTNYGTQTIVYFRGTGATDTHILIKFSLATIPAGSVIISATMKLNCTSHFSHQTCSVAPCLRAWTEAGATWNKYDGSSSWGTAGGTGAADKGSDIITNQEPATGWVSFTIPVATAQGWLGGTNNGLIIYYYGGGNDNDGDIFASSENATSGIRPKLEVVYDEPGGAFLLNML